MSRYCIETLLDETPSYLAITLIFIFSRFYLHRCHNSTKYMKISTFIIEFFIIFIQKNTYITLKKLPNKLQVNQYLKKFGLFLYAIYTFQGVTSH